MRSDNSYTLFHNVFIVGHRNFIYYVTAWCRRNIIFVARRSIQRSLDSGDGMGMGPWSQQLGPTFEAADFVLCVLTGRGLIGTVATMASGPVVQILVQNKNPLDRRKGSTSPSIPIWSY